MSINMSYTFHTTTDPEKIRQAYSVSGTEWGGNLTAEEFGYLESTRHEYTESSGDPIRIFYLQDQDGTIVATTSVKQTKGFYKDADRSNAISSIPDPTLFGVKNIRILILGHVFTLKDHRGKGLAQQVISKAIEYTETEIITEKIETSDASKNDSFKNMVLTDGIVDKQLANYYLSKQYFWVLYSAIGTWYERFGFRGYPLEFYKVPFSILTDSQESLVRQLISHATSPDLTLAVVGKKLKLLSGSSKADQDLISFVLQGKELEILTELNKIVSHSELQGDRRSSSSLVGLSDVLRRGSVNSMTAISEAVGSVPENPRRKSSVITGTIPKVAFKPSYSTFRGHHLISSGSAEKHNDKETAMKWNDVNGAIFTNELQQKSYYIIWHTYMFKKMVILGMGELKFEAFGALADPTGMGGTRSCRGSSFTGINELGGYNFQDLDILLSVACYVGKQRHYSHNDVVVSVNDLPSHIPGPILHDYFLNYLPKNFETVEGLDASNAETRVEFINDAAKSLLVLPMLKKFGSSSPEFELDWNASSMLSWN